MPSKKQTSKRIKTSRSAKKIHDWNEAHRSVRHLLEEELEGLMQYLRTIHYLCISLILTGIATLIFSIRVIFQTNTHAVVGFLVIIATSIAVITTSTWALRPWILPRFLLPLNLHQLDIHQLLDLFKDPDEYLVLVKTHIETLTDQYLIPKLRRIRAATILLVFGVSTAIVLAISLP